VQDANGNQLNLSYLPGGQLHAIVDAKGNATRFDYDASNRLARKTYADGSTELYTYNLATGTYTRQDATGGVTTYSYDPTGDLTSIVYPNTATGNVLFSYDDLDRRVGMSDGVGTTAWAYDNADRLTSESGPYANSTVAYSYDALDRVTGISVNGADATNYGYDGLSRLNGISSAGGTFTSAGSWSLSYNPTAIGNLSLPTLLQAPNGTQTAYTYDSLERLTNVQHQTNTGTVLSSFTYGFNNSTPKDAVQSLARESQNSSGVMSALQTVSFSYDSTDQLTGAPPPKAHPAPSG